jgi:hypothetical protein
MGSDFVSVAKYWIHDSKFKCLNVISVAAFWAIWKFQNDMCFNNVQWMGMSQVTRRCARMLRDWCLIQKSQDAAMLERWAEDPEKVGARPAKSFSA